MRTTLFTPSRLGMVLGLFAAAGGLFVYGCSDDETQAIDEPREDGGSGGTDSAQAGDTGSGPVDSGSTLSARAVIRPTADGGTVNGTAAFEPATGGGVTVTIAISGATPGKHGMHIHENGDCGAAPDGGAPGTAAGGHWNVDMSSHGHPESGMKHTGDMGNITINANGTGSLVITNPQWTISPGQYSVVNRAVIFHAGEDDGVSQPTGDAGARPGCGVIVLD